MRILYIIPIMGCGGAEILLGAIARNLVKKGHEVHILCLSPHHTTWSHYPERDALLNEVSISVIGGSVQFRLLRQPKIYNAAYRNYVEKLKPDIIHSHLYLSELLSRSYILTTSKYFSHGHDNMPQLKAFGLSTFKSKKLLANAWERFWLLKQYNLCNNNFIAISKNVQAYLAKELPAFSHKISYLPNAIDTNMFTTDRKYEKVQGAFHMVSIANLVAKKNHSLLIEVMQVLLEKGYDVTMEVLGMGPLMEELVAKTKSKGLENHLFFRGSVGNIPQKLWNAHLYVHSAWYEPFGLVLLEAMASGLPLVALDGIGNRELMKENQNGFMIPTKASAEEFASKIAYFIDNPDELERMGKFAREFSMEYDIDHYTDRLLDIYQNK